MLSDFHFRFRSLFCRASMEAQLDEELRCHLEHEVEKLKRSGMTQEESERSARLSFGGQEQVKDDCRDARGTRLVDSSVQDIRYGLRAMRRNPTFFAIAALTLALGIGASTAVFSLVNTILLKPLPYPNANQIMMLWRIGPPDAIFSGPDKWPWSPMEFFMLRQTSSVFQHLGGFKKESFNLTGAGDPVLLEGVRASAEFFPVLGISPMLGRVFTAEDDQPGHERVVVLSHRLWRSRFGSDAGIVGKVVDLNGYPYTVVGVMLAHFTFPDPEGIPASLDLPRETQLWVPFPIFGVRGPNELGVIGELKPGIRPLRVQQDLALFQKRLEGQISGEKGWSSFFVPLPQQTVMDARRPLLLLFSAVVLVMLIACSNVAGLVLNRSLGRRRELTMRAALGAGRKRLIRQLMTESLLLALTAGGLGILLGEISLYLVKSLGPASIPHLHEVTLDLRVMLYALAVTLLTGMLFGLAPAIGATRMSLVETLKEGGQRRGSNAAAPRIRQALLVGQIALALVLVIAAGLLVRSFYHMLRADSGFDTTRVITFELPLPSSKYSDTARMAYIYGEVLSRIRAVAGVQSAGLASVVPLGGAPDETMIRIPERPATKDGDQLFANYSFASPAYFSALGTSFLRGRDFGDQDTLSAMPVTIINNAMAWKYWPGQDPIGKRVGVGSVRYPVRTIVGVIADLKHGSLREQAESEMYVPYTQNEIKVWPAMQTMQFAVKTKADPASITESLRQAVHAVDPDLPLAKMATLATMVDDSMTSQLLRSTGFSAGVDRHVRRNLLFCDAADLGNRYPHGAGCAKNPDFWHDYRPGRSSWLRWHRAGSNRRAGHYPADGTLSVRGSTYGPGHVRGCVGVPGVDRSCRLLCSSAEGNQGRPHDRIAPRVVFAKLKGSLYCGKACWRS